MYYPFIKWAQCYCEYGEAQIVANMDREGSDTYKIELMKAQSK